MTEKHEIVAGYRRLPAGVRCRCPRMIERDGAHWCCKRDPNVPDRVLESAQKVHDYACRRFTFACRTRDQDAVTRYTALLQALEAEFPDLAMLEGQGSVYRG